MPTIPHISDLPKAITSLPHWVAWRQEAREGSTKLTKVPYSLATGRKARSNAPEDWTGFPGSLPDNYAGVGFIFSKDVGMTGIDLDDCIGADGIKPWAKDILASFHHTYNEISPSGTGIKLWIYASLPGPGTKRFVDSGGNPGPKTEDEADGAIEMYDTGRFFAVTGQALGGREIVHYQNEAEQLYARLRQDKATPAATAIPEGEVIQEGGRHNYLLAVAGRFRNGGLDREALLVALRQLNASKTSSPKPDHEIVGIVDFVMSKPAKYRLMPTDFTAQAKTADGATADSPEPAPETDDILTYTDRLLEAAITAKNPQLILGRGTEPSQLITALAQAGEIKQYEVRRRIKEAFKNDVPLRELDARVKAAEISLRPAETKSPYIFNSIGGMVPNLANAITMMLELPIRFNGFTLKPFLTDTSPWGTTGNWTDYDDARAAEWCQRQGLNIEIRTAASAAEAIALSRHPHSHPVRERLQSLRWDGEPRLNTWLHDRFGVPDTSYSRNVSRKWMISAVKRVMEPGCQADYTLVLEGPQGKRKSSALRTLCGAEWFTDDISDIGSKDSAMQLQGKWIVEIAELDAFRKAEMTTIKAWLVRREDHYRPPYGRRTGDFPRQNVFAASTNKEDWGMDDTGLRRFWPVPVGEIDIEGLAADRDHLWAEAVFAYTEGELPYMSDEIETIAHQEQHQRQHKDAWKDLIEAWVESPVGLNNGVYLRSYRGRVYLPEILQHCLDLPKKDWSIMNKSRVTRILRLAGFSEKRASAEEAEPDGRRVEYWTR